MDFDKMRIGLVLTHAEGLVADLIVVDVLRVEKLVALRWADQNHTLGADYSVDMLAQQGWSIKPGQIVKGSQVKIKPESDFYGQGDSNPADVVGIVRSAGKVGVRVHWENGNDNIYSYRDLELAGPDAPKPKEKKPRKVVMPKLTDVAKQVQEAVGDRNPTTVWYGVYGNGKVIRCTNEACHGGMGTYYMQKMDDAAKSKDIRWIVSDISRGLKTEANKAFLRWLIDKSVWAPAFRYRSAWCFKNKVVVCHTDLANNFLAGALIATRVTWEHCDIPKAFQPLVKAGIDGHIAFMAAPHISGLSKKSGGQVDLGNERGHYPVHIKVGKKYLKNFMTGHMQNKGEPWNKIKNYRHVNDTWGSDVGRSLIHETIVKSGKLTKSKSGGMWGGFVEKIKFTDLVDILKKIEEQL